MTQAVRITRIFVALLATIALLATMVVASPARADAAASTIEFLNPSTGSSLKISDKLAKDQTYALSAWVSNAAAVELVEFEISNPSNPLDRPTTIGTATAVSPDTYEYAWSIPASTMDGRYTLRAIAYSQDDTRYIELDRDEETVTILQNAETVDIVSPGRGGSFGMFTPAGRPANGVVDTVISTTTGWGRLFYTVSKPGTEPVWKLCGAQPQKKSVDGIGCALVATDLPSQVTAISAIANATAYMDAQGKDTGKEQPDPNADASADAARVTTYVQQPTQLLIEAATQKVTAGTNGIFPCSPAIKATLVDQLGDGILGANIDVHASGPTNNVFFDVLTLVTKNQAPDKGHGSLEPAKNCSAPVPSGTAVPDSNEKEMVHRNPGSLSIKHIESVATGGTDDSGAFSFKLVSEAPGTTQMTAWVDLQDDDLFCNGEPAGSGTIGWGADAEPTVPEEPGACGSLKAARSIALQASQSSVPRGTRVSLAGAISSATKACVAGQIVKLQARDLGSSVRFKTIVKKKTSELGVYRFRLPIKRGTEFRSVVSATKLCAGAKSVAAKVRVPR